MISTRTKSYIFISTFLFGAMTRINDIIVSTNNNLMKNKNNEMIIVIYMFNNWAYGYAVFIQLLWVLNELVTSIVTYILQIL